MHALSSPFFSLLSSPLRYLIAAYFPSFGKRRPTAGSNVLAASFFTFPTFFSPSLFFCWPAGLIILCGVQCLVGVSEMCVLVCMLAVVLGLYQACVRYTQTPFAPVSACRLRRTAIA